MTEWSVEPIWGSWWVPALTAVGLSALLFVGPSFRRLSGPRRFLLVGLRLLAILILFLAMIRPAFVTTTSKPQSHMLLVLGDRSRSMQLPHVSSGPTRWEAQRAAWQALQASLANAPATLEVRFFSYADDLTPLPSEAGKADLPAEPDGQQTDLGGALAAALRRETGKRFAGVILLGDGTPTALEPKAEWTQVGREMARQGIPLYTVVFGPVGDTAQSRDVAVESLPEQYSVFVKNELVIRGQVRLRGYANQEIPVQLVVEKLDDGTRSTLPTQRVRAREEGQTVAVEFPFTPESPGQYRLTMRAEVQPGELVLRNNELTSFLTVLEGGLRVLYLYGDLNGEQRLLRRSLNNSAEIELDDQYVDPRGRANWPINLSAALAPKHYDVLLLESVEAAALGDGHLETIKKLTEQGRGLMMIGGFTSFGPGGYADTPLALALPVRMSRLERQESGELGTTTRDFHLWEPLSPQPTRPHPVTNLAAESENQEVWRQLPPLYGANKLLNLADRAVVLLETADHTPLLIAGGYGNGRVLAFAGNSTRRWWQLGKQTEHRRFWRQAILWLAQREDLEPNDVWLRLEQRRYAPGLPIHFKGGARTAGGEPISGARFQLQLASTDGTRVPVRFLASTDQISGTLDAPQLPGDYLLELAADADGKPLGKTQVSLQVLDRDLELSNPNVGHDLMSRLAGMTAESGGRAVSPEELPGVVERILANPPEATVELQARWRLADKPADSWAVLLLLAIPLIIEWTLRNRWGLV